MVVIRIEHSTPDFETWKKQGFDSDPLDRKGSGVVRYRIMRSTSDPNYAMIDLEFNSQTEAKAMLERLKVMWGNVMERFGWSEMPKATIVDVIEDKEY